MDSTIDRNGSFMLELEPGRYRIGVWYSVDYSLTVPRRLCDEQPLAVHPRRAAYVHLSCGTDAR